MLLSVPIVIILGGLFLEPLSLTEGKPTIYMKNENDKLEPVLLPISSTVIPIPIGYYQQVKAGVGVHGVHNQKLTKQKMKLTKPSGPIKLITAEAATQDFKDLKMYLTDHFGQNFERTVCTNKPEISRNLNNIHQRI